MTLYIIDKNVLLQESGIGETIRGGLEKAGIMKYSEKDGYKHNHDGSITYEHPNTIHKTVPQSNGGMKTMDDFWRDSVKAGELGQH